jgi:hypothetical protein
MGAAALGLVQLGWLPWALLAPLVLGALAVAYVLHQVSARHAAPPRTSGAGKTQQQHALLRIMKN